MNAEDLCWWAVGLFLNARLSVLLHSNGPKDAIWAIHLRRPSWTAIARFECRGCRQTHYYSRIAQWLEWTESISVESHIIICLFSVEPGGEIRNSRGKLKPRCLSDNFWEQVAKVVFRRDALGAIQHNFAMGGINSTKILLCSSPISPEETLHKAFTQPKGIIMSPYTLGVCLTCRETSQQKSIRTWLTEPDTEGLSLY